MLRKSTMIVLTILTLVLFSKQGRAASVTSHARFINASPTKVDAGYVEIKWEADKVITEQEDDVEFVVEQSESEQFLTIKTIYNGPDKSTFISGLPNGEYFYRVRLGNESPSTWSDPLVVRVKHYSHRFALSLFGLGFISFAGIVGVIWYGNKTQEERGV